MKRTTSLKITFAIAGILIAIMFCLFAYWNHPVSAAADYSTGQSSNSRCWLYSSTTRYSDSQEFQNDAPHCWTEESEPITIELEVIPREKSEKSEKSEKVVVVETVETVEDNDQPETPETPEKPEKPEKPTKENKEKSDNGNHYGNPNKGDNNPKDTKNKHNGDDNIHD